MFKKLKQKIIQKLINEQKQNNINKDKNNPFGAILHYDNLLLGIYVDIDDEGKIVTYE
jgi:hypothetical protein